MHAFAATLGLPTTIARLNVAYGPYGHGGIPILFYQQMLAGEPIAVPHKGQHHCSPIHTDDIARQVPLLWATAGVPATVVNWGGDDAVGIQDLMSYISELTGVPADFVPSDVTRATLAFDNTRRKSVIGDCEIPWREGIRRTLETHFPGAVKTSLLEEYSKLSGIPVLCNTSANYSGCEFFPDVHSAAEWGRLKRIWNGDYLCRKRNSSDR